MVFVHKQVQFDSTELFAGAPTAASGALHDSAIGNQITVIVYKIRETTRRGDALHRYIPNAFLPCG